MAKYYNNIKKTGKLAGSVFAIRGGETIERAYNPVVYNPNTPAQVATRARLKLMSQLAAVMSPVIAMPKRGNVSARNRFVSENFIQTSYNNNQAEVTLANIQLTKGVIGIPSIGASRSAGGINVFFGSDQGVVDVDRVIYAAFDKQADGKLRLLGTAVATEASSGNSWAAALPYSSDEVVILAYGIRDNNSNASVIFGNLQAVTAETIAKLVVSSSLTENDITLTETRGTTLTAGTAE